MRPGGAGQWERPAAERPALQPGGGGEMQRQGSLDCGLGGIGGMPFRRGLEQARPGARAPCAHMHVRG